MRDRDRPTSWNHDSTMSAIWPAQNILIKRQSICAASMRDRGRPTSWKYDLITSSARGCYEPATSWVVRHFQSPKPVNANVGPWYNSVALSKRFVSWDSIVHRPCLKPDWIAIQDFRIRQMALYNWKVKAQGTARHIWPCQRQLKEPAMRRKDLSWCQCWDLIFSWCLLSRGGNSELQQQCAREQIY